MKTPIAVALLAALAVFGASAMTTDSAGIVALIKATPELQIDTSVPEIAGWNAKTHPYVRVKSEGEGVGGFIDPDFAAVGTLAGGMRALSVPLESGGSGGVFTQIVFAQNDVDSKPYFAGTIQSGGHLAVNVTYNGIVAILPKYGPNDPNCCPSHYAIQTFLIVNKKLKLSSEKTVVKP
jgi:hypothetical protein